jgi:hypothetical protein
MKPIPIPIPETINDVTPELCRRVAIDICGWDFVKVPIDANCPHNFIYQKDGIYVMGSSDFRPFTRIQDTKLCDPWLVGNKIYFNIYFNYFTKTYEAEIHIRDNEIQIQDGEYPIYAVLSVHDFSEPFARMIAILKAYNKIMEDKND